MKLYLFDDAVAGGFFPFALSRPVSELRFGVPLQRQRLASFAGRRPDGAVARPWLASFVEEGAPPVVEAAEIGDDTDRLLLSSRFVPAGGDGSRGAASGRTAGRRAGGRRGEAMEEDGFSPPKGPAVLVAEGEAAGCWLPAGTPTPDAGWLARPGELEGAGEVEVEGRMIGAVWELVRDGPDRTARDILRLAPELSRHREDELEEGVHLLGSHPLYVEDGARLEPGVVVDLREGPVWLGAGVEVRAGCRLAGPLFAGRRSHLLGGPLEAVSAGPVSHLRGEVSEVTTLGWTNKAHSGYLGHAYVGRWVNLGAGTTNSDLKNNYGRVRLGGPGGDVETGLLKLGCLLGDHAKTAIGTYLPTGSVVGAGANVFGEGRPPKWVPPFSWGGGPGAPVYREADFLETARTVMGRRDVPFGGQTEAWLSAVWEEARRRREEG